MTDIGYLVQYVLDNLSKTPEYVSYKESLAKLQQDPELYQKVNELREKNFQLTENEDIVSDELLDLSDALTNEYEDVINTELVKEFIEAEAAFCRLMQDFNLSLTEGLEFDR